MACRFEDFLEIVKGGYICEVDGKRVAKGDMNTEPYCNYDVASVGAESGALVIELKPFKSVMPECNPNDDWAKNIKHSLEMNRVSFDG